MKRTLRICATLCALAAVPLVGIAADHGDAPSAGDEPTADITDLYAWMDATATKVNLIMAVSAGAGADDQFSDAVTYVFNIASKDAFGDSDGPATQIKCHFPDGTNIECWAGNQYVIGDPSVEEGIASTQGGLRVFAGPRNDPFFLDYEAFGDAVELATSVIDDDGIASFDQTCPVLSEEQQTALVGTLIRGENAEDFFAGGNVLALVLQVDKSLIAGDGDILAVWGATHSK